MAGKKTGKRLLTWVLVLVMALSLLPLNALAAGGPETDGSSGMNFDKRLVDDKPDGDGNYTIQMTAQATGTTTTTTTVKPMDIALVLDVSGSMGDPIPTRFEKIDAKDVTKDKTYYVYAKHSTPLGLISWHSYDKVKWCDRCNSFTHNCFDFIVHNKGHKYDPTKDQFYTKIDEIDKIDALKAAVNGFIDQVAKNSADSSIAVVSFASEAANVSSGLQPVKTDAETLKAAVNKLSANGATRADLGMQEAARILDSGTNSKKVVVMFTDGEPTKHSEFSDTVANDTISAAKGMKDNGTKVFTVGVFDSDPDEKTYDYMNYVSSNYPNATSINNGGKGSDEGYYVTADSADSLSKVFKDISETITKPEPVNSKLDDKTVITDTLSDYFTFATGTVDGDVKVYAGQRELINGEDITVNLNPTTKTVTVTDYDFSKHYQGIGGDDEETLVIEIKVKPDTSYTNWGESGKYKTNEGNATVTLPNNDTPIAEAKSPKAHVNTYKVTYQPGEGSGTAYADQYYLNGATTQVKASDTFTAPDGYEFDCWKDENNKSYQVDDEITFDKSDVVLTAQWKLIEAAEPTPATVTLRETDANGNALINKHLTITAKEAETIQNAYFCVAVTAANDATEAVFTAEPRYATTTTVKDMTRTSDGTAVEGSFVFPKESVLTFTEEDTYTFTVKEVFDEHIKVNHTTYDDTEYTMTVNVTKDATENKLNAAVSFTKGEEDPTGSITFYNTYKTPVYDFNLNDPDTIKVNKEFKSKYDRSSPTMRFEATATIEKQETYIIVNPGIDNNVTNNGSAVPTKPDYTKVGEATGTVTLKAGKTEAFDFGKNSTFQLEQGDYRITVKETNSGDRYVTYDTKPYTRYFKVSEDGVISAIESITITNEYTKRHSAATPSKPTLNTGDHYAYVMGYPDGTVRPNGSITRAEVSTILFRLLSDKTRDEYFTTESSFTDVKAGAWYNNSIATLEKAGVIVDTAKGGAFRPNEAITRAELAAMLAQFSDAKPVKGVKFSDVPAEHWAYEAIAIAAKMGWIEGYPDGTFRPDATITRAEMMTLVNRALERVPSDEDHLLSKRVMLTFPDCKSGDWFYIAVQEATNSHTYERAATEKNGDEQWTALRANRDWTQLEK